MVLAISQGPGIFHRSENLPNNSIVTETDIGEDFLALFCFTDEENCCESANEARWLIPDGTVVGSNGDLFGRRGLSMLSLNRVPDAMLENGLYRCEIPDSEGDTQTLYAGVYSDDEGN